MNAEIIANPAGGSFNKDKLDKCIDILRTKFDDVRLTLTSSPNEAGSLVKNSTADVIIAAGGDGIINEAAAGMVDKEACFSALPFGTVNVFCREHKIPLNPVKAAEALNPDGRKMLPLGYLGDRPFVLMCGIGYDAYVVRNVTLKKYHKNKTFAHLKEGINALGEEYPQLTVFANGKEYEIYHAIVSIGNCYAGNYRLSKSIKEDTLNIFMHRGHDGRRLFGAIASIIMGAGFPEKAIYADTIKVVGTEHFQLDGEYINTGTSQNYIHIKKNAITLMR